MAHDVTETVEIPFVRLDPVPSGMKLAALAMLGVGALAMVGAFLVDAERAWHAYATNWLYFMSIAHGALLLVAAVTITKGLWSRPIRRIALSFVAFAPLSLLLMLPLFLGADSVFTWTHLDFGDGPKAMWLTVPFLAARNIFMLGALVLVELALAYWMLRPDLGLWRDRAPASARGLWSFILKNWEGQEVEEVKAHRMLSKLAVILALVYAFTMSVVAWDFAMSLEPYWFSTLFGPYFFMAAFLGGITGTIVLAVYYRKELGLENILVPTTFHDIGKLNFAFCIFWAYLFWAQFLLIWYGLLPNEQSYVIHRLEGPFAPVALVVFFGIFIIPFAGLMGVKPKKTPWILATFASIVLVALWLERYLLTYPSYYVGAEDIPLGWQEPGIALFFAGLMLLSLIWFARSFPLVQQWQPMSELELMGVEVEAPMETVTERP